MAGKTIDYVGTDGERMIIGMKNGEQFRIIWKDDTPVLEGVDVKITVSL